MKKLYYCVDRFDEPEILDKGTFKGYNYLIVNYGTHPCAYIELTKDHKYFETHYDDIEIDVHGGLTYNGYLWHKDKYYIGWDYAHYNDFDPNYGISKNLEENKRKWTTEEIFLEVISAINQLNNIIK